ncbi:MAG: response regulator transcription factor [Dehalococcoidia bacterium]
MTAGAFAPVDPAIAEYSWAALPGTIVLHASGAAVQRLTRRELQVLTLAVGGKRDREIANELGITPSAVEYHIHNVSAKLGATSRIQLGYVALEQRLVPK